MAVTDSSQGEHRQTRRTIRRVAPWIGTVLFIVTLGVGVGLLATKQLAFVSRDKNASVSVVTHACTADMIAKYNAYFTAASTDAQTTILKQAFDAATASKMYADDPNCVYIRYQYYYGLKDTTNAQAQLDALKTLAAAGHYATSEILNVQSIDALQLSLQLLTNPTNTGTQSSNGQG